MGIEGRNAQHVFGSWRRVPCTTIDNRLQHSGPQGVEACGVVEVDPHHVLVVTQRHVELRMLFGFGRVRGRRRYLG